MAKLTKIGATEAAIKDLAQRLEIDESAVETVSVEDVEFPDMSLGAAIVDEMSAQMLVSGWRISLEADGKKYEYRGTKYELRLFGFEGQNYVVQS